MVVVGLERCDGETSPCCHFLGGLADGGGDGFGHHVASVLWGEHYVGVESVDHVSAGAVVTLCVCHRAIVDRMAHRYRMRPTETQVAGLNMHCGHARFVWNLALEQNQHARALGQYSNQKVWTRDLAEARGSEAWLKAGSSSVQQAALRDLQQAFRNWWANPNHFRHPTWRARGRNDGFVIRDLTVRRLSRKWATVNVPKLGPVKFRLTRPLPETKSARVTVDRSGRWHVSFTAVPPKVEGPGDGTIVGVDRGIVIDFQASDGRLWDVPVLSPTEKCRRLRLQRKMARQVKGSNQRERTRLSLAKLAARDADRRKDAIEKATTELARTVDIVRIEDLKVSNMMRSAKGVVEAPGANVAQKRGLNRSIARTGWTMFATRLEHKIGDRLERVPAAFTSQRCSCCGIVDRGSRENQADFRCTSCGYTANADVNAANNIAAGLAVSGRGGTVQSGRPVKRQPLDVLCAQESPSVRAGRKSTHQSHNATGQASADSNSSNR